MLKLQYFGHLMQRTDSLEKTLILGQIEGRRGRGWQRMRWLDGTTDSNMSLRKLQEMLKDREAWRAVVHVVTKSWTRPRDWKQQRSLKKIKASLTSVIAGSNWIKHRRPDSPFKVSTQLKTVLSEMISAVLNPSLYTTLKVKSMFTEKLHEVF